MGWRGAGVPKSAKGGAYAASRCRSEKRCVFLQVESADARGGLKLSAEKSGPLGSTPKTCASANMNKPQLFLVSCISLVTTAMVFTIRGDISAALGTSFCLTPEQLE